MIRHHRVGSSVPCEGIALLPLPYKGWRDRQKEWDIRASCPNGRSWGQCAKWGTYAHCYEKSTLSTHLSDLSSIATKQARELLSSSE
jgi:hypothetical protein